MTMVKIINFNYFEILFNIWEFWDLHPYEALSVVLIFILLSDCIQWIHFLNLPHPLCNKLYWIMIWHTIIYLIYHQPLPSSSAPSSLHAFLGSSLRVKNNYFDLYSKNYVPPFTSTMVFLFSKLLVVLPFSCSTLNSLLTAQIIQIFICNIFFLPCTSLSSAGSAWPF